MLQNPDVVRASAGAKQNDVLRPTYRTDIDGLRALAILLVVIYHVWLGRVSGGVDVFLMISAFFLTESFVRRAQNERPAALGQFWARRFRRLLPAAAVTIVGVLGIAFVAYPQTEWTRIWRESWASLFYGENWALAFSEVDYYARDTVTPSPLQHFWSLSVQGQVFVLWPLLIAGTVLLLRNRRRLIRPALLVVFGVIFLGSLAFSIYETMTSQSFAYFDTRTRLWEFAAGSLIAILLPFIKLPAWARAVMGWLGVVGIIVCGLVLDVQGGFPGYLALWPVVSTAFVIAGGAELVRGGPDVLLSSKALRFLGRDAYALYLVHWPILITWMVVTGQSRPGWLSGLGIIALSLILARVISKFVENPLRRAPIFERSQRAGALVIVGAIAVVAIPLGTWQVVNAARTAALANAEATAYPGAAYVDAPSDFVLDDVPLRPFATALDDDWVSFGEDCSGAFAPSDPRLADTCQQNQHVLGNENPLILVMGDSHAQQLAAPLQALADDKDWGVISLLKGGCSIGIGAPSWSTSGVACDDWREAALEYAVALDPDASYLVVTRADPDARETLVEGIEDIIDGFDEHGIPVIAVRDNPRFTSDMYECALSDEICDITPPPADMPAIEALAERTIFVDFSRWLCPDGICTGQVGNIAVFIDDNHTSATYGRTLAPMLDEALIAGGLSTR